ncbi:MAG: ABC transporter permease [Saprospiraceae bacterium]
MAAKPQVPPKLAKRLLHWFLRPDLVEEVDGDLKEQFYRKLDKAGFRKARWNYWYQVLHYLRPFALRTTLFTSLNPFFMVRHHFKISLRNLARQKAYSMIKIVGLALAIAVCLLIALYIRQELTYDRHYKNGDRIYRLTNTSRFENEISQSVHYPAPMAAALKEDYPEFEQVGRYSATRIFGAGGNEIRRTDRFENSHEDDLIFVDQELLNILEVPFIAGNAEKALTEPGTMVITRSKADKYFPDEDPIGKTFIINNDETHQYKVNGVIENFPTTSHLQADFLVSLAGNEFYNGENTNWRNSNYLTYVLVRSGTNVPALEKKLAATVNKYFLPAVLESGDSEDIDWVKNFRFSLQPVKEIYLNEDGFTDFLAHGDIRYVWLFGAIAIFILLIASINFINLSTARSANRAREVGLRKVMGSQRSSLIAQFLSESVLLSILSFSMGLLLAILLLPHFNLLLARSLTIPWTAWWLWPVLLITALIIGFLAGIYPAFYLSAFVPASVLKGTLSRGSKSSTVRNTLVVVQFTISIALIAGTLVIDRQWGFILHKKLGYDKDQVLLLQGAHMLGDQVTTFKDELLRLPEVRNATVSAYLPVQGTKRNQNAFWKEGQKKDYGSMGSQRWDVDYDYIRTLGLRLAEGRAFSKEIRTDSQAVVINQAFAKALQLEHPVGQRISNEWGTWTIIGVVEDFHFDSFREAIGPLCFNLGRSPNTVAVKLKTTDMAATIASIKQLWMEFAPDQPARFTFLDQSYALMYEDIVRVERIFKGFTLLAIVISCMGLLALSIFMMEQRQKEVSIRKVLGASVQNIALLLTRSYFGLIVLAFFIAVPIAWVGMQRWLQDFAYRIEMDWRIFALAGGAAIVVTVLTVSFQAMRTAMIRPVESLRSE